MAVVLSVPLEFDGQLWSMRLDIIHRGLSSIVAILVSSVMQSVYRSYYMDGNAYASYIFISVCLIVVSG